MENTKENTNETIDENTEINHNLCNKTKCFVKDSTYCQANFCISCCENMGEENPRQYCCKTYCPYED